MMPEILICHYTTSHHQPRPDQRPTASQPAIDTRTQSAREPTRSGKVQFMDFIAILTIEILFYFSCLHHIISSASESSPALSSESVSFSTAEAKHFFHFFSFSNRGLRFVPFIQWSKCVAQKQETEKNEEIKTNLQLYTLYN